MKKLKRMATNLHLEVFPCLLFMWWKTYFKEVDLSCLIPYIWQKKKGFFIIIYIKAFNATSTGFF